MRDGAGFSSATRQRVLEAAAELGWLPSGNARGLASRRAGIVGLLFPDLDQSGEAEQESPLYVDEVIRGAERAATKVGDAVLIAATHTRTGRQLAFSVAGKVDGLVVMAGSLSNQDITAISRSLPLVILGRSRHKLDTITADNRGGAREITTHLINEHGFDDIAFVGGPPRSPDSIERFAGFRDALKSAGLPIPNKPDAIGGFTEEGGERAMRELLGHKRAIVFGNDEMAIGALSTLRKARIRVPTDIALTGFDDIGAARHVRPPLTTVRQPMRELGERSVRMLLDRLNNPNQPRCEVVLPTEVVRRRSCGCRGRA
ncbi:MAG TPA: LacI family DNA-binding transcriptional regulator [Pseudonocardiaceae bacterium]|nr:LacI family DNA-binding transcriptional regulator [Pseudonocardiaceae bacterium]